MTHIELIRINPHCVKYPYTLHARIEEVNGKVVQLEFKAMMNRMKFGRVV